MVILVKPFTVTEVDTRCIWILTDGAILLEVTALSARVLATPVNILIYIIMGMDRAILNRPAIWRPIPTDLLSVRTYRSSLPVQEGSLMTVATHDRPIYRYAQNFTSGKVRFSVCMFSDEKRKTVIAKYFKQLAKTLTEADAAKIVLGATNDKLDYMATTYEVES